MKSTIPPFLLAVLLSVHTYAAPLLRNPRPFAVPAESVSDLLAGDFDGDGWKDALVVDRGRSLIVLLSNGSPFSAPQVTPVTLAGFAPAVADVNGDGLDDVIAAGLQPRTIGVLLSNGDGTFRTGSTFSPSHHPGPLVVADFTGDGHLDIAAGATDPATSDAKIVVHPGDGSGHFSGERVTAAPADLRFLAAADLDADGKQDLIADGSNDRILSGNGDGTFTMTSESLTGGRVVTADFNRDGRVDLAITGSAEQDWFVEILSGNGDGTVTPSARYAVAYDADVIHMADLDDDGNLDLVAPGARGETISVLRGKPDGTFHPAEHFTGGDGASLSVLADFDRDGDEDLLISNQEARAVSLVRGGAGARFDTYRSFHTNRSVPGTNVHANDGTAADMNGDGHPDVVLAQEEPDGFAGDLVVMLNDGTGKLGAPIVTRTDFQSEPPYLAVADLNFDGKLDVVAVDDNFSLSRFVAKFFAGNGDGTFEPPLETELRYPGRPHLAHFDGDGSLDLFIATLDQTYVHPGRGNGTFGRAIQSSARAVDLFFGDLDGDGDTDVVSSEYRSAQALINDGSGRLIPTPVASDEIRVIALADFTADGRLDLLFGTGGGTELRPGIGNGTFGAKVEFAMQPAPVPPFAGPIATADFDGDGLLDFAAGSSICSGNGDGTFTSRSRFRATRFTDADAADMDGNGSVDLVLTSRDSDDVHVLLTRDAEVTARPATLTLERNQESAGYREPVAFTATVTGGLTALTGVVRFEIDGKPRGLIAVDPEGTAVFTGQFDVGTHEVTATYTGDEYYAAPPRSQSIEVTRAKTRLTIGGVPNPSRLGRRVLVFVNAGAPGAAPPPGRITVREGDVVLGRVQANTPLDIANFTLGEHVLTAEYAGSDDFEPATATYTHTVLRPLPEEVKIEVAPPEAIAGEPVQIRVSFPGSANITGSVTLSLDDQVVATNVPLVNGVAQYEITIARGGYHSIRADYSGDAAWDARYDYLTVEAYAGRWGTPLELEATASRFGDLFVSWLRIHGAASYTLWRKTFASDAWEPIETVPATTRYLSLQMPPNALWLLALTATDANGTVSPMSEAEAAIPGGWGTVP